MVAHPVVGAGLETLLRLERLDVRRVAGFDEVAEARAWSPDIALVDGVLLQGRARQTLGIPALVLSGSATDAEGLRRKLDDGRGWLRKDATPDELRGAIDRVLGHPVGSLRIRRTALVAALAAGGAAAFLAWGYLAIRAAG